MLHSLGDRHIYVFCYVAITQEVKAITTNNNTKFGKDMSNIISLKCPETKEVYKSS